MLNDELVALIQAGVNQRDNMERLFILNIGFIRQILNKYGYICNWNKYEGYSFKNITDKDFPHDIIEFQDLMQEAFFGLYDAAMGYDASQKVTFLTYAGPAIQRAVKRFIDNSGKVIRVSPHMKQKIYMYNQIQSHYLGKYGRKASVAEVADILDVSIKEIEKLEKFMFYTSEPQSLDAPLTADEDSDLTVVDSVADTSVNVEEAVIEDIVCEEIAGVWDEVSRVLKNPTMRDIIICRFRDNLTLVDTAARLGINRETARHLESKALRRLRSDSRTKRLFQMIA